MSIILHSYDKYQSLLTSENRKLFELPVNVFAQESIVRLNASTESQNNISEYDESDTYFFNLSSFEPGNQTIAELVKYKLVSNQKPFDVYFTPYSKKW